MNNDEPTALEILASIELQERYIAEATKDEYALPEDLWNYAADFVEHVARYEKALESHPELATMAVPEMHQRARAEIAPFVRTSGPFRDAVLSVQDVLVAREVPATALVAVGNLRYALTAHANAIKEAPSWAALVRESSGWATIRQAAKEYLNAIRASAVQSAE